MYIGETGRRLSDRFGEHLRSVEGFSHNTRYQVAGFPVAEHFNLPHHGGFKDMRVSVLKQTTEGTQRRQRGERRLIHRLGMLAPRCLNIDFKDVRAKNLYTTDFFHTLATVR